MIRIPYENRREITFHDFDVLMSVYVYRKKLKDGEYANSITLNASMVFWIGIFQLFCLLLICLTEDEPISGRDVVFRCVMGVVGICGMVSGAVTTSRMKRQFFQSMKNAGRAEVIFDEEGVHVWENPEKGFDKTWEQFTDCFMSEEYIIVLFESNQNGIFIANIENNEQLILEALALGNRTDIVTRFEVHDRQLKGLSNSAANQTGR